MKKLASLFQAFPLLLTACDGDGESSPASSSITSSSATASSATSSSTTSSSNMPSATTTEPVIEPEPVVNEDVETQPHGFFAPPEQQPEPEAPAPEPAYVAPAPAASYYANCAAVRAAGAAPLYAGSPGATAPNLTAMATALPASS